MRFTYRMTRDASDYIAECVETDAVGEGKSAESALESLRKSIEERMFRPDAVAPPSTPTRATIELVEAADGTEHEDKIDLGGPGDAPV